MKKNTESIINTENKLEVAIEFKGMGEISEGVKVVQTASDKMIKSWV